MRREFSKTVKAAALKRCCDKNGIPHCEECGIILTAGNIEFDHDKPDGLGGEPSLENCKVLCRNCHGDKTHGEDRPRMQKADRVKKKNFGVKGPSKFRGWRRMNGEAKSNPNYGR